MLHLSFQVRESTGNPKPLPLLVKIAPDLTEKEKKEIAGVVLATKARKRGGERERVIERESKPLSCFFSVSTESRLHRTPTRHAKNSRTPTTAIRQVDGLIVSNTTISRPSHLRSQCKDEAGGLSGRPLTKLATETIRDMYRLTKGKASVESCLCCSV